MSLGHGALGLVSGLRGIAELIDEDGGERQPFVEMWLGAEMPQGKWLFHAGAGTYRQRAHFVIADELRDVRAVSVDGAGLARVESLADCVATVGTYYFSGEDAVIFPGSPGWDDGSNAWDAGSPFWDLYPPAELYVHLAGDADPNNVAVVAFLTFYFCGGPTGASVHPTLGPDKFTDGDFDNWTTPSDLTSWTELTGGAPMSVSRESTIVHKGPYSVKLASSGGTAFADFAEVVQTRTVVPGRRYRAAGRYRTAARNPAGLVTLPILSNAAVTSFVQGDGRHASSSSTALILNRTDDEWRRFFIDFLAIDTTMNFHFRLWDIVGGLGAGEAYFDSVRLYRIYRYSPYASRLSLDSIPEVMTAVGRFFSTYTTGLSSISLINGGGSQGKYFERICGQLLTLRKPVLYALGGTFKDGTEVPREDWAPRFAGLTSEAFVDDRRATFQLMDWRSFLKKEIPPNDHVSPAAQSDIGRPRPLYFSHEDSDVYLKGTRVALDPTTGYGIYEVADPSNTFGLVTSFGSAYSFLDEEAADNAELSLAIIDASAYSFDPALARFTVVKDVRPIRLEVPLYVDFTRNGSTFLGTLALTGGLPTVKTIYDWCAALQTSMRATSGSAALTVTYSNSTHKVTIADPSASTFTLLFKTGGNAANSAAKILGYEAGGAAGDKTGALTYTAEAAVFTSPDTDHHIRFVSGGYKDDAAGTYTGIPDSAIRRAPHIARFLIARFLSVGEAFGPSFLVTALNDLPRFSRPTMVVYVAGREDADAVLARLERGALASIVMGGDGFFHWVSYTDNASKRTFYDRDYLSWTCGRVTQDVASGLVVSYQSTKNPGRRDSLARAIAGASTRHWARNIERIESHLYAAPPTNLDAVLALADAWGLLLGASPRVAVFRSKGKLADLKVGEIITLNQSQGVDPTGALINVKFRIVTLNYADSSDRGATCTALEYFEIP